ncbi:MAG TPA: winged helix-turn-helix domain-containing protein [Bryobacteraceae bacterium]|nr:winged helix-turn-helix domain-containing protein [Bryobacteraceae bacterium]
MATQPQSKARLAFGPFEVNAASGELFKYGARVRLPGQSFQILLALLEQPGELVTRELLLTKIWSDGTFVDFDHSLNAAINRLRRSLSDSAEKPRYIETVPGRGYRFIGTLEPPPAAALPANIPESLPAKHPRTWWPLASAVFCLMALALAAWWRFHDPPATLTPGRLTRLTADAGLSNASVLSPDGKMVAYSSDRGPEGARDLYVKQVAGGQPIRLTFDGAGNTTPDFSPEGDRIVFRSTRDGGGIYEMPALGGEARLLVKDGWNPRYSPDGAYVAYWVGGEGVALAVPGNGSVWVVPVTGGQPRPLAPNLTNARYPIWSPDGKHLLVIGYSSQKPYESAFVDWWLVPTDGGNGLRTGAYDALIRAKLQASDRAITQSNSIPNPNLPRPCCWVAATNTILFSAVAENGDSRDLWEGTISPTTGQVSGTFRRLTASAGNEVAPSCPAAGALTFTTVENRRAVWSFAADPGRGVPTAPERVTEGSAMHEHASLSADGRFVAFAAAQPTRLNIWLRELETGQESQVTASQFVQRFPVLNASGSKVAFSSYENGKRLIYVSSPGGIPEKMCEACLRATDWSRDDQSLLIFAGSPYQVSLLDIATRRQTTILKHDKYNLLFARFSPDNRWVSFTVRIDTNRSWIAIAPIDRQKPVPESSWIRIAEGAAEDWANWSADGKALYFTSARDGHFCLWAQRIDAASHRPLGDAFAIQHFHGRVSYQQGGWSAARGRIAIVLVEDTGNIWMMSRSNAR